MNKVTFRKIDLMLYVSAIVFGILVGPLAAKWVDRLWSINYGPSIARAAELEPTDFKQPSFPDDNFLCTPAGIGVFAERIHVRCTTAAPGGIIYFAVPTSDSRNAARFLSAALSAKAQAKNLMVYYDPVVLGTSFGCFSGDCRPMWGLEIQQ